MITKAKRDVPLELSYARPCLSASGQFQTSRQARWKTSSATLHRPRCVTFRCFRVTTHRNVRIYRSALELSTRRERMKLRRRCMHVSTYRRLCDTAEAVCPMKVAGQQFRSSSPAHLRRLAAARQPNEGVLWSNVTRRGTGQSPTTTVCAR